MHNEVHFVGGERRVCHVAPMALFIARRRQLWVTFSIISDTADLWYTFVLRSDFLYGWWCLKVCKIVYPLQIWKQWMQTERSQLLSFYLTAGYLSFISSLVSCMHMETHQWKTCLRISKFRTQWIYYCLELETFDMCWKLLLAWRLVLDLQGAPTR